MDPKIITSAAEIAAVGHPSHRMPGEVRVTLTVEALRGFLVSVLREATRPEMAASLDDLLTADALLDDPGSIGHRETDRFTTFDAATDGLDAAWAAFAADLGIDSAEVTLTARAGMEAAAVMLGAAGYAAGYSQPLPTGTDLAVARAALAAAALAA